MITILLQKILAALTQLLGDIKTKLNTIKNNLDDLIVVATAAGPIASFTTTITKPFISCKVEIKPKQASGTPTPSNPLPISGTDTVIVTQTGKNLFNTSNVLDAYLNTTSVIKNNINTKLVYAKCNPNTTYTVSKTAGQRFQVAYCDSLPTTDLLCGGMITDATASSITITTNATAKYIVAFVYHGSYDTITAEQMIASIQIEAGSTATVYEPYTATTKTVSLPQTVYGGEVDVVSGSGKKLTAIYTVTGEETSVQILQGTNNNGYRIGIPLVGSTNKYSGLLSSVSENANVLNANTWQINKFCTYSGRLYITVPDDYDTVEKALAYLKDGMFEFELATPTPITLANPIELTAISGVNNVFGDTDGNTIVEYLKLYKED